MTASTCLKTIKFRNLEMKTFILRKLFKLISFDIRIIIAAPTCLKTVKFKN